MSYNIQVINSQIEHTVNQHIHKEKGNPGVVEHLSKTHSAGMKVSYLTDRVSYRSHFEQLPLP